MTGVTGKRWDFFIWDDYNVEHLARHRVQHWEAEELFFNKYVITPNNRRHGPNRFLIRGRTNAGRKLIVVFEDFGDRVARIITGWDA